MHKFYIMHVPLTKNAYIKDALELYSLCNWEYDYHQVILEIITISRKAFVLRLRVFKIAST